MTVKAIPEGLHSITPHVCASDAAAFIDFCKKAFGAEEIRRMPGPGGHGIMHAALRIGSSWIFCADESVSGGHKSAKTAGASPITLQLNVENIDASFKRAVDAGATPTMPPMDMFWGDRYGQFKDPFGNSWSISQHIKDMTPAEIEVSTNAFFAAMAAKK
jgi:PhnB protein